MHVREQTAQSVGLIAEYVPGAQLVEGAGGLMFVDDIDVHRCIRCDQLDCVCDLR